MEIEETTAFWGLGALVIYPALFMGALIAFVVKNKRKRGSRRPFGDDAKLMRMPGEHLWRRIYQKDISEMQWTVALMLIPIILAGVTLQIATDHFGLSFIALGIALVVFLVALFCCIAWLGRRLERREREYLGFFAERFVADFLEPLTDKGWHIFHDMPCASATASFNLDHVAIGPGGIWVVETKARRKGRLRRGGTAKVRFDGTKLIWPRWEDPKSVKQAASHASWLQDWLEARMGKKFNVSVVLTIPGYNVEVTGTSKAGVRAAAPQDLQDMLIGQGQTVLSGEDIQLIRLQLANHCRDVVY